MARRKRKEEDLLWEPPKFDEVGYMRQEMQNAKIATAVIAWAIVGAILAYLVALWIPLVGYLVGLAAFGALYVLLPMLGLPIHGFKRRDWISHASVYFFSWLAFSIVLLNAPFGDHTAPVVGSFQVGSFTPSSGQTLPAANTVYCVPYSGGNVQVNAGTNASYYIQFRATDNLGIASINVTVDDGTYNGPVTYSDVSNQPSACLAKTPGTNVANTYAITYATAPSNVHVTITAKDTSGLSMTESIMVLKA